MDVITQLTKKQEQRMQEVIQHWLSELKDSAFIEYHI